MLRIFENGPLLNSFEKDSPRDRFAEPGSEPSLPSSTDMFGMQDFGSFEGLDASMFGSGDTLAGLGTVDFNADFNEWFNDPSLIGGEMK